MAKNFIELSGQLFSVARGVELKDQRTALGYS